MTENHAIMLIKGYIDYNDRADNGISAEPYELAIKALEEVQQYRSIGTVEECKEVREKQIRKKPSERKTGGNKLKRVFYHCPICRKELLDIAYLNGKIDHVKGRKIKFCCDCGQAIDWSEV